MNINWNMMRRTGGYALIGPTALLCGLVSAQEITFSTDVELHSGTWSNIGIHDDGVASLRLNTYDVPHRYMNVATLHGAGTSSGTIVRIDTDTGVVLGEYRTTPVGLASNPSRTSIDSQGNVWVGNRDILRIDEVCSVVKIGIVVGGQRCDQNGIDDPEGQYLRPPFLHCTAVDRDGDGLIRTSRGLGDILAWDGGTDSDGGQDARVEDAVDECILVFQRVPSPLVRHVSVDAADNVWVGDTPANTNSFLRLDGTTGGVLQDTGPLGCSGIGGLIDSSGLIWSANDALGRLMRLDPASPGSVQCIPIPQAYGLALDSQGNVWSSQHNTKMISKVAPDGTIIFESKLVPGSSVLRGLAVSPDDNVWVADSTEDVVFRLNSSGDVLGSPIPVGQRPTAVDIDSMENVWVVSKDSSDLQRISPFLGTSGEVDLTIPLTPGSSPQGYGDLTTTVTTEWAIARGYWTVLEDSGAEGTVWTHADWDSELPLGSSIRTFVRTGDNQEELALAAPFSVESGVPFESHGRLIEVHLRFISSQASHLSPAIYGLALNGRVPGLACTTPNRREAGSLLLFPYYTQGPGEITVISVTNTLPTETDVEYVYIDSSQCLEFNRTETLTGLDTLSFITSWHNPSAVDQGFIYAFAKNRGQASVHNGLIGQELILSGINEGLDYSINAVGFGGIGASGLTDLDGDGVRDLDGLEYEMAPESLLIPRFLGQHGDNQLIDHSRLILISLTGGDQFSTIVDLLIYNDNEESFSSTYEFSCWANPKLVEITEAFEQDFLQTTDQDRSELLGAPGIETGWFRIDGSSASSSATTLPNPAVYAVLVDFMGLAGVSADLPFELCVQANGGLVQRGLHGDS